MKPFSVYAGRIKRLLKRPRRAAGSGLRLHLGCGLDYWPGYINIDTDPSAASDLQMDFIDIERHFTSESVSEVVMIHSLGYLTLWQARDLFASLYRLLKPGGTLLIELPDLARCARTILESRAEPELYLEGVRALFAFDMDQVRKRQVYVPYAFGWSAWHLEAELRDAGFSEVKIKDPETHGPRLWRDIRLEALK